MAKVISREGLAWRFSMRCPCSSMAGLAVGKGVGCKHGQMPLTKVWSFPWPKIQVCIELRAVPVPIAQVFSLLLDVVGCPISTKSIIVAMVPKSWPAMQSGQFLAFTTEMQHLMEVTHREGSSSAFTPVAPQPFSCCAEINAPKENATPAFCLSGISLKVLKTYICVSLDVLWVFPLKLTKWIRLHRIKAKWVLTHHAGKSRWSGSLEGKEEESAELAPFILCFYLFKGYFF